MNSTGEMETLRRAEARAREEERVSVAELLRESSSEPESELGFAFRVWRKQEGLRNGWDLKVSGRVEVLIAESKGI